LRALGVAAELAPDPVAAAPLEAGPCFRLAAGGEVVVGRRKLVGSAQARFGDALLQHGSILLADDQELLAELGGGRTAAHERPATLEELLGGPVPPGLLESAVADSFRDAVVGLDEGGSFPAVAVELEERYRSEAWTWRR